MVSCSLSWNSPEVTFNLTEMETRDEWRKYPPREDLAQIPRDARTLYRGAARYQAQLSYGHSCLAFSKPMSSPSA